MLIGHVCVRIHRFPFIPASTSHFSFSSLTRLPSEPHFNFFFLNEKTAFSTPYPPSTEPFLPRIHHHRPHCLDSILLFVIQKTQPRRVPFGLCFCCTDSEKSTSGRGKRIVKQTLRTCVFLILSLRFEPALFLNEGVRVDTWDG